MRHNCLARRASEPRGRWVLPDARANAEETGGRQESQLDSGQRHATAGHAASGSGCTSADAVQYLSSGVKEHNASMRCYGGDISRKELAIADAGGFCYAPQVSGSTNSTGKMAMGETTKK